MLIFSLRDTDNDNNIFKLNPYGSTKRWTKTPKDSETQGAISSSSVSHRTQQGGRGYTSRATQGKQPLPTRPAAQDQTGKEGETMMGYKEILELCERRIRLERRAGYKGKIMTTDQLLDLRLPFENAEVVSKTMLAIAKTIQEGGDILATIITDKETIVTQFQDHFDGADKDAFAELVNEKRQECDLVIFFCEMWYSEHRVKGKPLMGDWEDFPRPSEDLNRKEGVILNTFLKDRKLAFMAEIEDDHSRLGQWELAYDSNDPDAIVGGRFA